MQSKESWIVIRRSTGEAVFETTSPNTVELVDHSKACVMTAFSWHAAEVRAVVMTEEASRK